MKSVIFHVVNSIKGGCGKSTFSLLIADYYQTEHINTHKNNSKNAFIIDLDWYGTSWYKNYDNFFEKDNAKYITELMFDFEEKSKEGIYHSLRYKHETGDNDNKEVNCISVCMADSEKVIISDVEQDLYENVIYNVIRKTIEDYGSNCDGTLHIILDMPPSYETYSDRVLNHLLLDQTSSLYKDFESGKFGTSEYYVNLYMVSALSKAHVDLNLKFVKDFINGYSYSSLLPKLNRENRFKLFFIVNDPNHVIDENRNTINKEQVKSIIDTQLTVVRSNYRCLHIGMFPFLRMSYQNEVEAWLNPTASLNFLNLESRVTTEFNSLISSFDKS